METIENIKNIENIENMYLIKFNGTYPFIVENDVKNKQAIIYEVEYKYELKNEIYNRTYTKKKILTISYKKIFITDNTILLSLSSYELMLITHDIYTFNVSNDLIYEFNSTLENNDVPYPYAIGHLYVYLLAEWVAIPKNELDLTKHIYDQYYGFLSKKEDDIYANLYKNVPDKISEFHIFSNVYYQHSSNE